MEHRRNLGKRDKAWAAAKLAVRRYSRNPCEATAADVRKNFRELRALPSAKPTVVQAVRSGRIDRANLG